MRNSVLTLTLVGAATLFQTVLSQGSLPQVDLGYEIHQAIGFNVSRLLSFSIPWHTYNIRSKPFKPIISAISDTLSRPSVNYDSQLRYPQRVEILSYRMAALPPSVLKLLLVGLLSAASSRQHLRKAMRQISTTAPLLPLFKLNQAARVINPNRGKRRTACFWM